MTPNNNQYLVDSEVQKGRGLWSGIIAGFFISILAFWILSTLGIAISGHSIANIDRDELKALGIGASAWILGSAVLATALGGYFCSRIVAYSSWRAGIGEGLVVSSIFFLFLSVQSGLGIAVVGQGISKTAELAAGTASQMVNRSEVRAVIDEALDGATFKAEPSVIAARIGQDLLRGDLQGVKNYLRYQTDISAAELDARVKSLSASFNRAVTEIQTKAGAALAAAGWFAFFASLLGSIGCCLGAVFGAYQNTRFGHRTTAYKAAA